MITDFAKKLSVTETKSSRGRQKISSVAMRGREPSSAFHTALDAVSKIKGKEKR